MPLYLIEIYDKYNEFEGDYDAFVKANSKEDAKYYWSKSLTGIEEIDNEEALSNCTVLQFPDLDKIPDGLVYCEIIP